MGKEKAKASTHPYEKDQRTMSMEQTKLKKEKDKAYHNQTISDSNLVRKSRAGSDEIYIYQNSILFEKRKDEGTERKEQKTFGNQSAEKSLLDISKKVNIVLENI